MANERALLEKLVYFNYPAYLIFHVTNRCNSNCIYCFNWKKLNSIDKNNELNLKEIELIAKELPHLMQLTFSGGEPTQRDDLPEICYLFCKHSKVNLITLPTNGLNPDRLFEIVKTIRKKTPDTYLRVVLTLNGMENLHDKLSGIKGSFQKNIESFNKIESIRNIDKFINIDIVTLLLKENEPEIEAVTDFIRKNLKVNSHLLILVRGNIKNPQNKLVDPEVYYSYAKKITKTVNRNKQKPFSRISEVITEMSVDKIFDIIVNNQAVLPCLAGKKLLVIDPDGNLRPCEYLDKSFGSLRNNNFHINKLLKNNNGKEICDYIKKSGCFCTWECSMQANIIYNPFVWPEIAMRFFGQGKTWGRS